ncbi:MAG: nucleotide sugar dehydrogenase [Planctomycetota bacterium]
MHKVSIFGLGYVGCVSAGCLARLGHKVVGVDVNTHKVDLINAGKPTIVEADVDALIAAQHAAGRLSATTDAVAAVSATEVSLICVGTPSDDTGRPDLAAVVHVAGQIGRALADADAFHTVVIRSTVPPGTADLVERTIAETSGRAASEAFAVVGNPEFLREGSSVADYFHPQYTVVGTDNERARRVVHALYAGIDAPMLDTSREVAELIKYASNTFHALKVVFANEVAAVCKTFGVDSHAVMDLLCRDTRLNISPAYLKPGFAFGGSCLPKDLWAINVFARDRGLEVPVLAGIGRSNAVQVERALETILAVGRKRVGMLGLAFKGGTDDLRESPVVELLERLLGKGCDLSIHDSNVSVTRLMGANKRFIEERFPHLVRHMVDDLDTMAERADVIVVSQRSDEYAGFVEAILDDHVVVDLVRIFEAPPASPNYIGLGW